MSSPLARWAIARRPANQVLAPRCSRQRDHDSFASFPGPADAVPLAVLGKGVVHPIRDPQQCQLTERRQVARSEVVAKRRVDLLGRIDVAVRHTAPQRLGIHVDELDLVGGAYGAVGDGLTLADAGDLFDDVVERLEMLDVDGGDDVDPCVEDLPHVLPALRIP